MSLNLPIIWSFGGGTQSAALAVLVVQRDERGGVYLHRDRVSLEDADLTERKMPLLDLCDSGYCWT